MRNSPRRKTPEKIFLPTQDPMAVEEFKRSVADLRRFSPTPQEQAGPKKEKVRQTEARKPDVVPKEKKREQSRQQKQMDLDLDL